MPVYCVPGNHDDEAAMRAALRARPFQICGTAGHGDWLLVMLNSAVRGSAGGRIAPDELARLDASLAAQRDRHALVCLHHHPLPSGSRWLDSVALANADELFAVLDRHAHVRGLLWGHVHQAWEGERRGVRLLSTPSTCAQFKPNSDGFALDARPPAYRWLELGADGRIATGVQWVADAALAARPGEPPAGAQASAG